MTVWNNCNFEICSDSTRRNLSEQNLLGLTTFWFLFPDLRIQESCWPIFKKMRVLFPFHVVEIHTLQMICLIPTLCAICWVCTAFGGCTRSEQQMLRATRNEAASWKICIKRWVFQKNVSLSTTDPWHCSGIFLTGYRHFIHWRLKLCRISEHRLVFWLCLQWTRVRIHDQNPAFWAENYWSIFFQNETKMCVSNHFWNEKEIQWSTKRMHFPLTWSLPDSLFTLD